MARGGGVRAYLHVAWGCSRGAVDGGCGGWCVCVAHPLLMEVGEASGGGGGDAQVFVWTVMRGGLGVGNTEAVFDAGCGLL